jgi:hypothetical protein
MSELPTSENQSIRTEAHKLALANSRKPWARRWLRANGGSYWFLQARAREAESKSHG